MSAPWLRTIVLDDTDDGNYVIPNIESVVVGGTHQTGDWDTVSGDTIPYHTNIESVVVGGTHQTGHWDTVISYQILET